MLADFIALFFPRYCFSCHGPLARGEASICSPCAINLPRTHYHKDSENPVFRKFYGLVPVEHAFGYLHFTKQGSVQKLLHHLKYDNRPEIGLQLGRWYGNELRMAKLHEAWDIILPIPLHPAKKRKRGYNQSDGFAQGLGEILEIPHATDILRRTRKTDTQTKKNREERYQNMAAVFEVVHPPDLKGKRVLLVDDVVTTGATLQACGEAILAAKAHSLSVAALAVAQ